MRRFIPNFRTAHYVYIIFMCFLGSVIVYPMSNFAYIDILFLMSGSCTQAGLNTINLNDLKLLQQIFVYLFATLTTPIFIHLSLLFVRLYWFERHFDNIKESSMLNFKMRRNATLAARTNSLDPTMANTVTNQGLGFSVRRPSLNLTRRPEAAGLPPNLEKGHAAVSDENHSHTESSESAQKGSSLPDNEAPDNFNMYSEPSDDDDDQPRIAPDQIALGNHQDKIKFGDLPHPSKKRKEVDPTDMYKSITMLQKNRRDSGVGAEEDVLVIKSPKEIENNRNMPIFTKKSPFHSSSRRNMKWRVKNLRRKHGRDHVRRSGKPVKRRISLTSFNENESIDSEEEDEDENEGRKGLKYIDDLLDTDDDGANQEDGNYSVFSDDSANDADNDGQKSEIVDPKDTTFKPKFAMSPTGDRDLPVRKTRSRKLSRWRTPTIARFRTGTDQNLGAETDDEENDLCRVISANYLSWVPTIGRNSTFIHMTDEQKKELGGVEYRAVKLLIKVLVVFYIGFHIVAFLFFVIFINIAKGYAVKMRADGISPTWWGFFTAQSSFNDLGLTLTPNSMLTYNKSAYILIVSSFFIIIGNTGFPIILRFIVWVMFKFSKPLSLFEESLGFLLDHPRRCFTMLFPSLPTWWLFFILVALNATDLILFIILDFGSNYLLDIPKGFRVLDGLYQAFSTRTAGFSVVDLSRLHPAVQVSYMIMMYISVLPMAISIRRTNVYEEQSLGIYAVDADDNSEKNTEKSFIGSHLRNQLSFDLWFIFLGLFIICIAEGGKLRNNDIRFTIFSVLFEIISAYGTVGLSLGYPNVDQSLSHEFTTISKLVIIAMMIRGRHRGLPYSLDRAIMLPSEHMKKRDMLQETHAAQRAQRIETAPTMSTFTDPHASTSERLNGLRRTITRKAVAYRKNSMFPSPTKLPSELHEMRTYPLQSQA